MKSIGEIIRTARETLGMSQGELADKVRQLTGQGFTRSALNQIELGSTKNPKPHNLQAACDVLGINFRGAISGKLIWVLHGSFDGNTHKVNEQKALSCTGTAEKQDSERKAVIDSDLLHDVQTEVDAYIVKHNIALSPRQRTAVIVAAYILSEPIKRVSDADVASALADIMALAKKQTHG